MNTIPADVDCKIYFDQSLNAVVMNWRGYFTSDQFREGTEYMLDTLIQHNCNRVLAAVRDLVLISADDQEWLMRKFVPRAIQFGFRSVAIVRPQSYFGNVAIERVTENVNTKNLTVSIFDTTEDAVGWLKMN